LDYTNYLYCLSNVYIGSVIANDTEDCNKSYISLLIISVILVISGVEKGSFILLFVVLMCPIRHLGVFSNPNVYVSHVLHVRVPTRIPKLNSFICLLNKN